ncbi:hypothetical protein BCR36DRAFT_345958 [Piromyces finnis]|uniref:G-protein coupled receptors family 3 profile domain-containing protein n=1 Tax=Piromyces finnis TaxID=1754191 RepID=A0A1Y1VHW4_9FUNG|nr:hypothetical protein BCR36DRAFT_345958 [Piromyces finnis]|eukprot:ORX56629.1 hypothetical protein BCR36DRAFT_345958 [Piromyces finnis]
MFNGKLLNGAGALTLSYSNNTFNNTEFENVFSENYGGSISLKYTYTTIIDIVMFKNVTSLESGHTFTITSDNFYNTTTYVYNITQIGDQNRLIRNSIEGTFFSTYGNNILSIENYYGTDISTGTVMSFDGDVKAVLKNITMENIYIKDEGSLIRTTNKLINGANISFDFLNVNNIYHENYGYDSTLVHSNGSKIKFNNSTFTNIEGTHIGLVYQENEAVILMNFVDILNFYSLHSHPVFNINNNDFFTETSFFGFSLSLKNVFQDGVLFLINSCYVELYHTEIDNIHYCHENNECSLLKEEIDDNSEAALIEFNGVVDLTTFSMLIKFNYCLLNKIYGLIGFKVKPGMTEISNSMITNSYFKYGLMYFSNEWESQFSIITINTVIFKNNTSYRGTLLYYNDVKSGAPTMISIYNSQFIDNTATNYGGLIYSNGRNDESLGIYITDCIFENNKALLGNICYSYDILHEPFFSNSDPSNNINLRSDKNNFVTNPTRLLFDNYNTDDTLEIYSGDRIDQEYSCTIYDDYKNTFKIDSSINELKLDNLIFYEISLIGVRDKSIRTKVTGSYKGFCINNQCKFKDLRLIANPGEYILQLEIVSFGHYYEFKQNKISLNVIIKECNNNTYINQDKYGVNIKACYLPACEPICMNNGNCVTDNLCDCSNTKFTGKDCTERYKLKRNQFLNISLITISISSIIYTFIIMLFLFYYKNHEIVKAGSYDFLNLILIGLICNFIYILLLTKYNFSDIQCTIIAYLKNLGFSLIFGSIITKSYRVFFIFKAIKTINVKYIILSKYGFLISYVLIQSTLALIEHLTHSSKLIVINDENEKEFEVCVYNKIQVTSSVLNVIAIIIGTCFAYGIRKINKKFKEPLSVPIYIFLSYILLNSVVEKINGNNYTLIYYFNSIGLIISSHFILYFLYIRKFIDIHYEKKNHVRRSNIFMITSTWLNNKAKDNLATPSNVRTNRLSEVVTYKVKGEEEQLSYAEQN